MTAIDNKVVSSEISRLERFLGSFSSEVTKKALKKADRIYFYLRFWWLS